ncbi:33 kDa chaperonin HslO [hydrothermal vent metagenome]|uniref:33 kDa chaperonin HslO n=1 Tax=hydrothermal vent metagenome TaxID=652676 RepID=A0A3B0XGP8_9ZZZZ
MADTDSIDRFILEHTRVRGEIVHLQDTWQAVLARYDYPENVKKILGEAFAACALLSATIKYDGSLILQIRGDGPLHLLVVQATSAGTLRGLARWSGDVPAQNLQSIFGNGQMVMTIEPPKGEPYQGIIALQGEHIKDAIESYFIQSEQLNTRLWLASDEKKCAGFLLQELPLSENEKNVSTGIDQNELNNNWQHAVHLASTLQDNELLTLPTSEILHRLFHESDVRLFESAPLSFRCSCSQARIEKMILSLGQNEANEIIKDQGKIQVDCEFCNAQYNFDSAGVEKLFSDDRDSTSTQTLH